MARIGDAGGGHNRVADLEGEAAVGSVRKAKVAVFVGNAWDAQPGRPGSGASAITPGAGV